MRMYIVLFLVLIFTGCGGGGSFESVTSENDTIDVNTKFIPFFPVGSGSDYNGSAAYSFIIGDGKCEPHWDWDADANLDKYKFLVKSGFISFGGEGGEYTSLAYLCDENDLYNAYKKVIDTYGIKWLDFDIEGGMLTQTEVNEKRFEVLKKLQNNYPDLKISLTLPVMPYGFDIETQNLIKLAKDYGINIYAYNLMLMDYGEDYPADDKNKTQMFDYSYEAIKNADRFLSSLFGRDCLNKIGVTAMIGKNDVNNEIWFKNDFALLKDYVLKNNLSFLSFWSVNRDRYGEDIDTSTGLDEKTYGVMKYEYTNIGRLVDYPVRFLDQNNTFYWQLQGNLKDVNADIYDIDLFDSSTETIENLKKEGKTVICYFSAGTWENWRSDASLFPQSVIGNSVEGWPGEKWLDVRSQSVRDIMEKRLDLAVEKGCDGVEPDNVDGYENNTGFDISYNDQLEYNIFLALEAKKRKLLIALKNDFDQTEELASYFDFMLSEQALEYNETYTFLPFILQQKPVYDVEYNESYFNCSKADGFHLMLFSKELNGSLIKSCDY